MENLNLQIESLSQIQLLQLYGRIIETFQERKICTTNNPPLGEYTEWLISRAFNITERPKNSNKGFDLKDKKIKYQIKARRIASETEIKTQLSALRNLNKPKFDFLIAVIYNHDFTIKYAYQYPVTLVKEIVGDSYFNKQTNSINFYVEKEHLNQYNMSKGLKDLTVELQELRKSTNF